MHTYYYSAARNGFFSTDLKKEYESSLTGWPDDAIAITDEDYKAIFQGQLKGKVITADSSGKPVLSDPPPQTTEQLVEAAEAERASLMAVATAAIAPLQDAVDIDDATDAEITLLKEWKKYRVALNRLDLSFVPDIDWPQLPV